MTYALFRRQFKEHQSPARPDRACYIERKLARQSLQQGGHGQAATQGGINVGARGNLGGYTFHDIGKGATLTFTTTDNGAVAAAQRAIERVIDAQANTTAAALSNLGGLAETRVTDGGNLITKASTVGIVAVAIIGALLAVAFYFRRWTIFRH